MGLLQVFTNFFSLLISTYCMAGNTAIATMSDGFHAPLAHFGPNEVVQTMLLAMVPILSISATIKLFHGPVRLVLLLGMLGALFHVTWPIMDDFVGMV
jgi:hypothetical protein